MKLWNVYGKVTLKGILAETAEAAIKVANQICNDDPMVMDEFFKAVEVKDEPTQENE